MRGRGGRRESSEISVSMAEGCLVGGVWLGVEEAGKGGGGDLKNYLRN